MLKYKDKDGILTSIVKYSDLYIEEVLEYGDKTLCFSIPVIYAENILLENYILTKTDEYVIKQKNTDDAGNYVITAKLNIDELEGSLFQSFETEEKTAVDTANLALAGTGWLCECEVLKKRTIRLTNVSVWEILKKIADTFILEMQIDSVNKRIIFKEKIGEDKGVYFADQLNLISLEMQSNTSDFYTRLLPLGKDGLTIENVNDGKKYVENYTYSSKVKTFLWKDDRYTDAQSLKDDAAAKLADMAQPYTAYSCKIFDMAQYSNLYKEFFIGDTVTIINKETKTRIQQRIVKIRRYPDNHSNDTCEISNLKLTFDEYIQKYNDTSNTVNNITVDNGTVDGDSINNIDASKILRLDEVIAENAKFNEVSAELLNVTKQLNAANAKIGTLETTKISATEADLKYAKIDLTNIEAGSIKTAMIETGAIGTAQIADGSITDAKIVGVTADKITAGTIDAAQIEVVNLNAANITVGSINGVQIASGAIDMSKLGSDVSSWISTTESNVDKALKDAGLASSNASSAVTAADSAVSIANGKNTSYYQKTAPAGGKVNDIWFDTDDGYKMYYWNGSAWSAAQYGSSAISANAIAADKIASGAVTEVKISNGAVTADKIRSNSILARHLVITDFENYCTTDENYPDTDNSSSTAIVDGYVTKEDASVEYMALNNFVPIPFMEETEIFFEAYVKGTNGSKIQGAVALYDDANKTLAVYETEIFNVTETLAKVSGTINVKKVDNAVTFRVLVHDTSTTKAQLYLQKIKFYKKTGTTLISDGAITTDKISVNAVTANNIAASAVTAGKIAAGAVTANNIAANAVTAGKIAANAVTTSTIAAGAITTVKIAASAVTAAKIAIADYTNYATINELIPSSAMTNRVLISDGYLIKQNSDSNTMLFCDYTPNVFSQNDEVHYEFTIKAASETKMRAVIFFYNSSKGYLFSRVDSQYTVTTEEQKISGTIKINIALGEAAYFIVGIDNNFGAKTQLYVKNAKFIRKSGTTLISDGAITTDKIVAQAVTGAKIAASTITANNIAANAVTADKINVSSLSAISANLGTITAGVIQSTNYVANSVGMKLNLATGAWDSKYFKISSSGEITATRGTVGGFTILSDRLYADYGSYRAYVQAPEGEDKWVFAALENKEGEYKANWSVLADGRMYAYNKVVIDSSGKDAGSYIIMETWGTSGDKHQTKTNGLEYRAHNLTNNNYAKLQASGLWFGNEAESNVRGSITLNDSNLMLTTFDIYRTKNANGIIKGWFRDTVFIMQDGWNNNAIYADWNGNFSCTGTKNRIVETDNFGQVKMNAFETAGAYFADIMSGRIAADGKCVIYLDRKFAETIDRDCEYQVILTAVKKASELYVIKDEEYFTVCGQAGTDFDCMIIGRQKGYVTSYADSVDFSGLGEEVSENVTN